MYGWRWTNAYGHNVDPTGMWSITLAGLTGKQIADGLIALSNVEEFKTFPPSAKEFRALCLPNTDTLGLPPEGAAYQMFCTITNTAGAGQWDQVPAIVYYTYKTLDPFQLKRVDATQHRRLFLEAYRLAVMKAGEGFVFPPVPQALEHKEHTLTDVERERQKRMAVTAMAKIRKMF